jgi:anthranilate synthase component 1
MFYPSLEETSKLSKQYNRIPVYKEMDISEISILLILKCLQENHDVIFLESANQEKRPARFSYIGFNPRTTYHFKAPNMVEVTPEGEKIVADNYFEFIKETIDKYSSPQQEQFGDFNGGLAGFMGYEIVNQTGILRKPVRESKSIPQSTLFHIDDFICHDNKLNKFYLATALYTEDNSDLEAEYKKIVARLEETEHKIIEMISLTSIPYVPSFTNEFDLTFRESFDSFTSKVDKIKQLVIDGEALQVVLSMRADIPDYIDPYTFYRRLRKLNPSPYMFYLKNGKTVITGSSPEIHIKVDNNKISLKPIAGTIKKSEDQEKNKRNKEQLLHDPKENAEHLMLVDLARNDISRIAKSESLKVSTFMQAEEFSHVYHLVSTVEAELAEHKHQVDVLKETFPAGTVSGAPKVRAMEIIDEFEEHARDIYAGAVGYIGFNNQTDTCITIRTAYFTPEGNYIQAGAGIVQDSVPEFEYKEICNKLRALAVSIPAEKKN